MKSFLSKEPQELTTENNIDLEAKFEEAINYVFEVLSYLKVKILSSAVTGRNLTLLKRNKGFDKVFGSINYDSLTQERDERGIVLLFPESALP